MEGNLMQMRLPLDANPSRAAFYIRKLGSKTANSSPNLFSLHFSQSRFQFSTCPPPIYSSPPSPPSSVRLLPLLFTPTPSFTSSPPLQSMAFSSLHLPHPRTPPSGEVHVIIGPMFAGKTTALLRRIRSEEADGRKVVIIKSSKDTRYAVDAVVTHDGARVSCWALPDLRSFKRKLGADAYAKVDVIGIDEAQFFEDLYEFCSEAADYDGKVVIVAGLDGDYLRRRFGCMMDIIPLADTVTKLTARCEMCGKRAFFTLRKTEDTRTELIAGADVYMPVCRTHYHTSHVVVKRDDIPTMVVSA